MKAKIANLITLARGELIRSRYREEKVFCIGMGKTGTTSLKAALKRIGYRMGNQAHAERFFDAWARRDFRPIVEYCLGADAFQDIPFSLPYTFQVLDQYFPNARFILSLRTSADEWYESLVRFHSKKWADGVRTPTVEDLKAAVYNIDPYSTFKKLYDTPDTNLYDEVALKAFYERHVANVRDYFRSRPNKLIEINVAEQGNYLRMCAFLGRPPQTDAFPWLNRT